MFFVWLGRWDNIRNFEGFPGGDIDGDVDADMRM
jgi:hypothetical protein